MTAFARTDNSLLSQWWWTVDRWNLAAIAALCLTGIVLILAGSPSVAERLNYHPYHFIQRHLVFLPFAIILLLVTSIMSARGIRRLSIAAFAVSLALMCVSFILGTEINGAKRWITFAGISLQPSEFIKPSFAVLAGWLFSIARSSGERAGYQISIGLFISVVGILLLQPDFGMTVVISAVWFTQFFLAGLPVLWVMLFIVMGLSASVGAYLFLPHVASRIDRFIDPSSGDSYQVMRSLQAFGNGGPFGRGPGEGSIKTVLPDAHTDFIFAVAGEEFGLFVCLIIVGIFSFIVLRGSIKALKENDLFILLSVFGLLVQFGLQAFINMGSTLHLIPTKGMTLPFISYGGSSLFAAALCMGMVLALTRRRFRTDRLS